MLELCDDRRGMDVVLAHLWVILYAKIVLFSEVLLLSVRIEG